VLVSQRVQPVSCTWTGSATLLLLATSKEHFSLGEDRPPSLPPDCLLRRNHSTPIVQSSLLAPYLRLGAPATSSSVARGMRRSQRSMDSTQDVSHKAYIIDQEAYGCHQRCAHGEKRLSLSLFFSSPIASHQFGLLDRPPDLLCRERHVQVPNAKGAKRIDDGVDNGRRRSDGTSLADPLDT
jgi:hypothetical protein